MTASAPLLSMVGIGKSYPGARVLDGVDLALRAGEVHVLLGANGAGKSTLMKILCGQVPADEGAIELDGAAIRPDSPRAAEQLGILCIHQELNLVPGLTVADNVFLGHEPTRRGLIDTAAMRATTRELLGRLRARIDPDARVGALSVAEQQLVEIARALRQRPRVLVMDEPTASLSDREIDALFAVVRQLVADGVAVVFISHRMPEIFAIGHRVTVLRDGRSVGSHPVADVDAAALVRLMVGRAPDLQFPARAASPGEEVLRVEGLAGGKLQPVTLSVRAGEVLGIAGVVGAGRTELLRALFGADPPAAGRVLVGGRAIARRGPAGAIAAGLGFVTEDRTRLGRVLPRGVGENITLAAVRRAFISLGEERGVARGFLSRLSIRATSPAQPVGELSGGNQQKAVLARWIHRGSRVLLLDEPTRGIDVAAKAEIYQLIGELVDAGAAVILVSSELPELLALSDRIAVLHQGHLAAVLDRAEATHERVLGLALGHAAA